MQHVISTHKIHLAGNNSYTATAKQTLGLNQFITWCELQQGNSFFWLGISFMAGIGAVLPLTLCGIVFFGGNWLALWRIACVSNVPVLVVNLALQSTKITLPVLFSAWIIDVMIICYCLVHFFTV